MPIILCILLIVCGGIGTGLGLYYKDASENQPGIKNIKIITKIIFSTQKSIIYL